MHQKVLRRFQKLQISIAILKHPRWEKVGSLFFSTVHTLKKILATARTQKEDTNKITLFQEQRKQNRKSKYYRVAFRKALFL
jgi:hypothetical protein